jgi:hypothetical protein
MDALLGGLIDLLFGGLGRIVWRALRGIGLVKEKFSEGGYEALGFVFFLMFGFSVFFFWGLIT